MSWDFDRDFVKFPRKLIELLCDDPLALAVYVALLSRAAWRDGTVITKHGPIDLQRGQAVFGRVEIARLCRASERSSRNALQTLKTVQAIELKPTNHGTIVTIVGYSGFGCSDPAGDPAGDPAVSSGVIQRPAPKTSTTKISDLRSKKEDHSTPARARDPYTPVPVQAPVGDAPSGSLYFGAIKKLNEARLDIAGRLGIKARPLHDQDHKTQLALLPLIQSTRDRFQADFDHVLEMRIAEALRDRSVRWLSGSMFEPGAWRQALAMTRDDVDADESEHDADGELEMPARADSGPGENALAIFGGAAGMAEILRELGETE